MSGVSVPSDIYLDTSLIAAAIIGGDPHSAASLRFCNTLATQNSAVYLSQLLRLEFAHVIRNIATTGSALPHIHQQYQLDQFNTDAGIRQQWMQVGLADLEALLSTFAVVYELPFRARIWQRGIPLMSQYNLGSFDAAHVATALAAGVRDFAAVDGHFRRVSALRLHLIR